MSCNTLNGYAKLGVDSLELRRLRLDLIYVYKLLFDKVDADVPTLFVVSNVDTVTREIINCLYSNHVLMLVNTSSHIALCRAGIVKSAGHIRRLFVFDMLQKFSVAN